jgi:hypothetical protein
MYDQQESDHSSGMRRLRWPAVIVALIVIGFVWPYDPAATIDHWQDSAWLLGWLTVLVGIGAACGYLFRTLWTALAIPVFLYIGGAVSWFQFQHGWHEPDWSEFAGVSAFAFGVLLLTAGAAAAVASRVRYGEAYSTGRSTGGIRLAGAVAGMLGLLSVTAIAIFPLPYLAGMLGFAAVLAGIAMMQEDAPNGRERLLAAAGIALGMTIVGIQLYAVWGIVRGFIN